MRIKIVSCTMVREKSLNYTLDNDAFCSPAAIAKLAYDVMHMDIKSEEYMYAIMLDTKNHVNAISEISHGSLNSAIVHPREIFKIALLANAASIIVLHNHPSGDPTPSKEDVETTERLSKAASILGIKLLDHIVIGGRRHVSLKEQCLM